MDAFHALKFKVIDHLSLMLENDGFSPLVGRILGLLLFAGEPLSLQEMAESLGVTKAAISVQVRALEKNSMCHRMATSSDRKDYYYITDDVNMKFIQSGVEKLNIAREGIRFTLAAFPKEDEIKEEDRSSYDVSKRRFTELNALYELLFKRLDGIEDEWHQKKLELAKELDSR